VLKKGFKTGFSVSVELLIGDRLSVREQLRDRPVALRLCTEEQARRLLAGQIATSNMSVIHNAKCNMMVYLCTAAMQSASSRRTLQL
jgi:hypothetical protein